MEELSKRQKQVLALLLAGILLGTGSLVYQHRQSGPVEIFTVAPVTEAWPGGEFRAEVVVHVSGAVAAPGVYHLPVGSRVYQALEAAGGALPGARVDLLNLASVLKDGERIKVPAGETAGGGASPTGDAPAPTSGTGNSGNRRQ